MKPWRKVIATAHVVEFRLECGHATHRPPFDGKTVIPQRMGCAECEQETFRRFDLAQAIARARREALEEASKS